MTIELPTPAAAHALADYLRRCDCVVVVDDRILQVSPPERSQTAREARIEMEAYLRVWAALNPTIEITLSHGD
jgi:hypothetical protein